ncbi:MAG: potassium channel family protein [Bacillus sp. (in: firmicutes)]
MMKKQKKQMRFIPRLVKLIIVIFLIMLVFGYIITQVEPQTFPTFFDGIWWTIITIATVGYGDLVPSTIAGKVIGISLIFIGAGFVVTYFSVVSAAAVYSEESFMNGTKEFNGANHIIIVGWNERSRNIIENLQAENINKTIVLIDHTLARHPDLLGNHYFIRGKATDDEILKKANIREAKKILITANNQQDEFQADMFSILTLLACKGLNPSIFSCVEILTVTQRSNAQRAGADQIIQTNIATSKKMASILKEE